MMRALLRHELRWLFRNRRLQLLGVITAPLLIASGFAGDRAVRTAGRERERAVAQTRADWVAQGPVNPHNAPHFGSFAFKPVGTLAILDGGIDASVGNIIRLEAHAQNDAQYAAASQQSALVRLGSLDPALVLLVLVPLLMIAIGYATIAADRENGRLQVMVVQGVSLSAVFWPKNNRVMGPGNVFPGRNWHSGTRVGVQGRCACRRGCAQPGSRNGRSICNVAPLGHAACYHRLGHRL